MGTPGGLDARESEGGRLDERDPRRQELVFEERERLDALGSGQFVDQSRQELLGAHGSPPAPEMTQPSPNPVGSELPAGAGSFDIRLTVVRDVGLRMG